MARIIQRFKFQTFQWWSTFKTNNYIGQGLTNGCDIVKDCFLFLLSQHLCRLINVFVCTMCTNTTVQIKKPMSTFDRRRPNSQWRANTLIMHITTIIKYIKKHTVRIIKMTTVLIPTRGGKKGLNKTSHICTKPLNSCSPDQTDPCADCRNEMMRQPPAFYPGNKKTLHCTAYCSAGRKQYIHSTS